MWKGSAVQRWRNRLVRKNNKKGENMQASVPVIEIQSRLASEGGGEDFISSHIDKSRSLLTSA